MANKNGSSKIPAMIFWGVVAIINQQTVYHTHSQFTIMISSVAMAIGVGSLVYYLVSD